MMDTQQSRRYRAIFFDMFGTIASGSTDDEAHMHLMESLSDRYNLTTEPPLLLRQFNTALRESSSGTETAWVHHLELATRTFEGLLGDHGHPVRPEDGTWFNDEYLRVHQSFVRLLPGAREALEELSRSGLHIGLIADCDTRYLDRQLCWLDIVSLIDSRTTSEETGARKPDERIFRAALRKAQCDPQQAIFVCEDVECGIYGAKAVGMTTVLLDMGMARTELSKADFVASHPTRLVKILVELAYSP